MPLVSKKIISKTVRAKTKTSLKIPYLIKFLNPRDIINNLEILPGMKVAQFGCGTGFFTFPVAEKVGKNGVVYALDILEQKVEAIKSQAKLSNLGNIIVKKVNLEEKEGSEIKKESVDWVIMANMLYQNRNKSYIIKEAKRILKKDGRALLIDWNPANNAIGPKKHYRVSKEELVKIIKKYRLNVQEELAVGDFHFGMVLVK
ncbi:MAG TPA: methyltransferase domain-containing protein [Candidatus Moranbacteria bacterium]|nr:methyltransferase domain-containing protein [Candidatus Moranbacteria bacterium]